MHTLPFIATLTAALDEATRPGHQYHSLQIEGFTLHPPDDDRGAYIIALVAMGDFGPRWMIPAAQIEQMRDGAITELAFTLLKLVRDEVDRRAGNRAAVFGG